MLKLRKYEKNTPNFFQNKGVCPDIHVQGSQNNQVQTFERENGVFTVTYRRDLINRYGLKKQSFIDSILKQPLRYDSLIPSRVENPSRIMAF